MSPSNETRTDTDDTLLEAIGAIGDRRRLEILLVLAKRERELEEHGHSMSFTELYDAAEFGSSSQFSYHLERLVGPFVTETPEGYRLTYAGNKIVRAIRSGVYESNPTFEDHAVAGGCVFCERNSLVATLHDEHFVVRCRSCEATVVTDFFPRSQARGRTPAEIVESFGYRIWSTYVQVRGGVCPECFGRVDTTVDAHEHEGNPLYTHRSVCRECEIQVHMPIEVAAVFHPTAVAFLWKHGLSLLDLPLWELLGYVSAGVVRTEIHSSDPFEATVSLTLEDETLVLSMDDVSSVTPVPARENEE